MKWKHTLVISLSVALLGSAAYATAPAISATLIKWATASSTPCTAGTSCMWVKTSDGLPYWHKTDNTNTSMVASGSGTVTSVACGTGLAGGTITTSGTCSVSTAQGQTIAPTDDTYAYGDATHRLTGLGTKTITSGSSAMVLGSTVAASGSAVNLKFNSPASYSAGDHITEWTVNSTLRGIAWWDNGLSMMCYGGVYGNGAICGQSSVLWFRHNGDALTMFLSGTDFNPYADGGLTLGSASHRWSSGFTGSSGADATCDAANRGGYRTFFAAGGSPDKFRVCMKATLDTYSWVDVGTAL